jgi:uncharacterized repeat protein (TIGR01451 family)
MRKLSSHRGQKGQSMVEFALTSLLFIGLLVSIIEIARIMHAYLTLQHAARVGARYAVTGRWMEEYAVDPTAGWVAGSSNPIERIAPCWPRFNDDPVSPTPNGPEYYEPFRGPRTCSIERQTLDQLVMLKLNPDAGYDDPEYYEVIVSSYASDTTPTEGTFIRDNETLNFDDYYQNEAETPGVVRGFAGPPQQKVVVQVRYNIRMITPLLANIVPYITLQSKAVMTNEAFGSTSALTEAGKKPILPEVDPLHIPIPPDLVIMSGSVNINNPDPDESVEYKFSVSNIGELNTESGYTLKIYSSPEPIANVRAPLTAPGLSSIGSIGFGPHEAGMTLSGSTSVSFTEAGKYYIYAWVDSGEAIDEVGSGSVANGNREKNNAHFVGQIQVGKPVRLGLTMSTDDLRPKKHDIITYTINVTNSGESDLYGLNVTVPVPDGFTYQSHTVDIGSYESGQWSLDLAAHGGSATLTITVVVDANQGTRIKATASIAGLPHGYYNDGELPSKQLKFEVDNSDHDG